MEDPIRRELREIVSSLKAFIRLERESGHTEYFSVPGERPLPLAGSLRWEELERQMLCCKRCGLARSRNTVVIGTGDCAARLVFVGEAPGGEEDLQGKPFVGRAGALLTKIIEAMGMTRERVYITNVLKCRPPNNRAPLPTEIAECRENVLRQIDLIRPKVVCTLGKFASQTLLETDTPITHLRGRFFDFRGIRLMPTFHPAYLLRNPQDKHLVWHDMKLIMKELAQS